MRNCWIKERVINIGARLAITVFVDSINGNIGKLVLLIKHVSYIEVDSTAKLH